MRVEGRCRVWMFEVGTGSRTWKIPRRGPYVDKQWSSKREGDGLCGRMKSSKRFIFKE